MSHKGLILYASMTGNTEKVAMSFKKAFERKGWQCDSLNVTQNVDVHNCPYRVDDYDLLCVGSPIIQGIPVKEIFDDHLGILMPSNLFRGVSRRSGEFGEITRSYGAKKGVVFVTYGGTRCGPPEAIPALDCLELRLQDMKIKCIGKLACAGGTHWGQARAMDEFADALGWNIEDAVNSLQRYMANPEDPEFASLPGESRDLLALAAKQHKNIRVRERARTWHWDIDHRPNARDLLKAEIFMEEILEDYYEGDVEAALLAQYICIA